MYSLIFSSFFINSFQFFSKNLKHFPICFKFTSKAKKVSLKWNEICRWFFKSNKTNAFVGLNNCFLKFLSTSKFWGWNFHFFLATRTWIEKSPRFWENDKERSLIWPVICRVAGCGWLFQLLLLRQLSASNSSDYLI